jgi:glutathione S-transferase
MKIYDWRLAPNPKRLRMFLVEKNIDIPIEEVAGDDLRLRPDYIARYPQAMVPMLELDDGTQLGESMAICRFSRGAAAGTAPDGRRRERPGDRRDVGTSRL